MEAPPFWLALHGGVLQNGMPTCKVIMNTETMCPSTHVRTGWKPKCPERWNQEVLKLEAFLCGVSKEKYTTELGLGLAYL
jgi:hypothetical protein